MSKFLSVLFAIYISTSITSAQSYNIKDFGAVGDGEILNTEAIQRTIDKCFNDGGGKVYVPAGVFITGTIHLKSNINMYLESGATLKAVPILTIILLFSVRDLILPTMVCFLRSTL
jgi:polygalacturonase